jgi:heme a synthase
MLPPVFRTLTPITLTLVFLVILAGGTVRTTGSGMGCPDWPKCFGQYIPPTDVSQLPVDYKTRFAVQGKQIAEFSAFKTWVEYINRLLGALLGVVIIVQLAASVSLWRRDRVVVLLCVALLIVTGFVGWLGSVVVATDLAPVKITTHMLASFCIVALAVTAWHRSRQLRYETETEFSSSTANGFSLRKLQPIVWAALALTLLQVVLGTQVREQIDVIAQTLEGRWRDLWVSQLSRVFEVHRSFSIVVLLVNAYIIRELWKASSGASNGAILRGFGLALGSGIFAEILLGVIMAYLAMPRAAQPLHLLFASGIFGVQLALLLHLRSVRTPEMQPTHVHGNETMRVTV